MRQPYEPLLGRINKLETHPDGRFGGGGADERIDNSLLFSEKIMLNGKWFTSLKRVL